LLVGSQRIGLPQRVEPGSKKRLVSIDIAQSGQKFLIEQ
jgi:hypothetical protein